MADNVASLNPEDFVEGGGLIDDVDITINEAVFEMFDYQGTVTPGTPSLKVVMVTEEEEMDQYYSMGSNQDWAPSGDGAQLMAIGKAQNIRATSNGGIFLKSLIDSGFPVDKLGSDISVLKGLQAHVLRVPAPKRSGIKQTAKQKEREEKYGPPTLLVISEIKTLPWEKSKTEGAPGGKKKGKGKGKGKDKAKDASAEGVDMEAKALQAVLKILEEEGTVAKKDLPAKIFQAMKVDPDRNAVIKIVFEDEFLSNGPWTFEDGTLISS